MLDLSDIDVEEIATALADQTDYEHRWLIDPHTGEVAYWTSDTGIDGENPVEIDELDLIPIDPLPPSVWFQDMADFADGISDLAAGRRLARSLRGRGPFRRFKNQIHEHHPDLIPAWHSCGMLELDAEPSNGCSTKDSSTPRPRNSSRPSTQTRAWVEPTGCAATVLASHGRRRHAAERSSSAASPSGLARATR